MKHRNGYTLIEISFALIVIGIISAGVLVKLNSFSKYHTLEKSAWTIYQEYLSLRSKAMKNNCTVRVKFLTEKKFIIHTDLNNNAVVDISEKCDTTKLPSIIQFGLPSKNPPTIAPGGTTLPTNGNYTSGNWKNDGIIADSTAAAVINTGSVYLNSLNFEKYTFCIAVTDSTQVFKMLKWNGNKWIDLR
jgi:prepilin-type N-terminal cleavage/methylation domain-containing protein